MFLNGSFIADRTFSMEIEFSVGHLQCFIKRFVDFFVLLALSLFLPLVSCWNDRLSGNTCLPAKNKVNQASPPSAEHLDYDWLPLARGDTYLHFDSECLCSTFQGTPLHISMSKLMREKAETFTKEAPLSPLGGYV